MVISKDSTGTDATAPTIVTVAAYPASRTCPKRERTTQRRTGFERPQRLK